MTNAYPHSQHPSAMPLPLADRRGTSQGSCFLLHLLSLASASGLASCSNLSGTPSPALTLRLAILFAFRKSSVAASQPFGHPCRAPFTRLAQNIPHLALPARCDSLLLDAPTAREQPYAPQRQQSKSRRLGNGAEVVNQHIPGSGGDTTAEKYTDVVRRRENVC